MVVGRGGRCVCAPVLPLYRADSLSKLAPGIVRLACWACPVPIEKMVPKCRRAVVRHLRLLALVQAHHGGELIDDRKRYVANVSRRALLACVGAAVQDNASVPHVACLKKGPRS